MRISKGWLAALGVAMGIQACVIVDDSHERMQCVEENALCSWVPKGCTGRQDMRGADLYAADLSGTDFSCADLRGADLYAADLSRANLQGADLRGATLYAADLGGANLQGADLRCADLYAADLSGADLRGANLFRAQMGAVDMENANTRGMVRADVVANDCRPESTPEREDDDLQ